MSKSPKPGTPDTEAISLVAQNLPPPAYAPQDEDTILLVLQPQHGSTSTKRQDEEDPLPECSPERPVEKLFLKMNCVGLLRWVFAFLALGFPAALLTHDPPRLIVIGAGFNIGVVRSYSFMICDEMVKAGIDDSHHTHVPQVCMAARCRGCPSTEVVPHLAVHVNVPVGRLALPHLPLPAAAGKP